MRPISKPAVIKVTKSPPHERSASPVAGGGDAGSIETTAAVGEKKQATDPEASAVGVHNDDEEDGQEYYLHFLGYSKGQDRWERESNFVPLNEDARKLKERMHNQWDRKKSAHTAATLCPLPGDPENVQVGYGAVRYGASVLDVVPECLNGILPPAPTDGAAAQSGGAVAETAAAAAAGGNTVADTASLHLRQFGCTTLPTSLSEEDVSACATVIEQWFNHVVVKLNTLGLQDVMKNVGFTEFKLRGPGRYDLNPPALKDDDVFAFFRSDDAPWVAACRSILGDDMKCIAMGCMLSMPGSDAQPMHQDGPHLNAEEFDKLNGGSGESGIPTASRTQQKSAGGKKGGSGTVEHLDPYAINVFVPLVDISVENGGTEFWLGTHRLGHFEDQSPSMVLL